MNTTNIVTRTKDWWADSAFAEFLIRSAAISLCVFAFIVGCAALFGIGYVFYAGAWGWVFLIVPVGSAVTYGLSSLGIYLWEDF